MDFPQNNSNYQPNNNPSTLPSSGSVPPPPQPEVNVRTMQSDVQSMQERGGNAPVPQQVSPAEVSSFQAEGEKPKSNKRVWWLLLLLLIIASGIGTYYYFFMMRGEPAINDNLAQNTPPIQTQETPATISLTNLNAALKNESNELLPPDNFKEIALVNEEGRPISFFSLISAILPDLAGTELSNTIKENFSDEFQAYLYYDENGIWPIYAAQLKDNSSIDILTLRAQLLAMENASIGNFYIDTPGPAPLFKDGQINGFPTRYATFQGKAGASFNYGLIDSDLYLSTSFKGLKRVLEP